MERRFLRTIGKKGVNVPMRMIVLIVIFVAILIVLAFILLAFHPQPSILDKAYALGTRIFNVGSKWQV
jgi:hypothetical protein